MSVSSGDIRRTGENQVRSSGWSAPQVSVSSLATYGEYGFGDTTLGSVEGRTADIKAPNSGPQTPQPQQPGKNKNSAFCKAEQSRPEYGRIVPLFLYLVPIIFGLVLLQTLGSAMSQRVTESSAVLQVCRLELINAHCNIRMHDSNATYRNLVNSHGSARKSVEELSPEYVLRQTQ